MCSFASKTQQTYRQLGGLYICGTLTLRFPFPTTANCQMLGCTLECTSEELLTDVRGRDPPGTTKIRDGSVMRSCTCSRLLYSAVRFRISDFNADCWASLMFPETGSTMSTTQGLRWPTATHRATKSEHVRSTLSSIALRTKVSFLTS